MANLKDTKWFAWLSCWAPMLLILAGCGDSFDREMGLSDLENSNPALRIMAIKWAGDNKVSSAVPRLVDFLQDEDPSVRFYAIEALQRITGTDCGYDYKAPAPLRAAATKRWREFLEQNQF